MSAQAGDEDDPEVQRNGLSVIQDIADIPDHAMREFYDEDFNPSQSWGDNLDAFFDRFRQVNNVIKNREDEIRGQVDE